MRARIKDPEYTQSMYGLMAILSQGPMSGYDVRKALDDREMYYWRESSGNIYPMLRELHADGLLEKTDAYTKRKKRVLYSLTGKGRQELERWLGEPAGLSRFRVELLMKLRFGAGLGIETLLGHLAHYRGRIQEQLNEVADILAEIDEAGDSLENDIRRIAINRFGMDMEAVLRWCDSSRKLLVRRLNRELPDGQKLPWSEDREYPARTYQGYFRTDPWGLPPGIPARNVVSLRAQYRAGLRRVCP